MQSPEGGGAQVADMSVAVIGAGPSGLVAAKELLEGGFQRVTIFERNTHGVGGLWNQEGGHTWPRMRTNLSKFTCCFSDFAWEDGDGDGEDAPSQHFPLAAQVQEYLERYCQHFGLHKHLRLARDVTSVRLLPDGRRFELRWRPTAADSSTACADEVVEHFDKVVVASGVFSRGCVPSELPGCEQLLAVGKAMHSSAFKDASAFRGRHVMVVGASFSGYEVAAELAAEGVAVTHVVNRPCWVLPRYLPGRRDGVPIDLVLYRRDRRRSTPKDPWEAARRRHRFLSQAAGNPGASCAELRVDEPLGAGAAGAAAPPPVYVAISDRYLSLVRQGRIAVCRGRASEFRADARADDVKVTVVDGRPGDPRASTRRVDRVVLCTGYECRLDFLSEDIKEEIAYDPSDLLQPVLLDICTLLPERSTLRHKLAFVGMYRGPYFGVMELQARLVSAVFCHGLSCTMANLQAIETMRQNAQSLRQQCRDSDGRHRPQFAQDYITLADTLAQVLGVHPLHTAIGSQEGHGNGVADGPVLPAHYRLVGPGAKPSIAGPEVARVQEVLSTAGL